MVRKWGRKKMGWSFVLKSRRDRKKRDRRMNQATEGTRLKAQEQEWEAFLEESRTDLYKA